MNPQDEVQCSLYYPGRGFKIDKVRLAAMDLEEWLALQAAITDLDRSLPLLARLLTSPFPISISRSEVLDLVAEAEQIELIDELKSPALDAYLTLWMFLSQAHQQREAGASFEIDPGARHEGQTIVLAGVDVLADLEEINRAAGEFRPPPDNLIHRTGL